jgi:hypothetical protein
VSPLQEAFGVSINTSLHALDLLIGEVFFTSPRLANLATQAEVLQQQQGPLQASVQGLTLLALLAAGAV